MKAIVRGSVAIEKLEDEGIQRGRTVRGQDKMKYGSLEK